HPAVSSVGDADDSLQWYMMRWSRRRRSALSSAEHVAVEGLGFGGAQGAQVAVLGAGAVGLAEAVVADAGGVAEVGVGRDFAEEVLVGLRGFGEAVGVVVEAAQGAQQGEVVDAARARQLVLGERVGGAAEVVVT